MKLLNRLAFVFPLALAPLLDVGAYGAVIDFTQFGQGSGEVLDLGGVTVSAGSSGGALPSSSSQGLGSALLGNFGTVDRIESFTYNSIGGSYSGGGYSREALSLSVNGTINSVTILPYFTVTGSNGEDFMPFDVSYGGLFYHSVVSSEPTVIDVSNFLMSGLELGLVQNWGIQPRLSYAMSYPGQDYTFQFGFSIVSLDYTPVPDAETTAILFGTALLAMIVIWRRLAHV